MAFDRFEIWIDPTQFIHWPDGGGFQPVGIIINDEPLIDLVRRIEQPFVQEEFRQRVEAGEDLKELHFLAGDYQYLPPSLVLLPCRNLLDNPRKPGFMLEPGDSRNGKATVLGCTCGVIDCWFLQVRISLKKDRIIWSEFGQFHRDWPYELGPFIYNRRQYETELTKQV